MAANVIRVHPLVLLNVVDHVTRFDLSVKDKATTTAAVPEEGPMFLSTAGLLMGTPSSESDSTGISTTLSTSFELPLRLGENGEAVSRACVSGSGTAAAFAVRLLSEDVDWAAARQHREQLDAVLPECAVVGCYLVCRGGRASPTSPAAVALKKPRSEPPAPQRRSGLAEPDAQAVAECLSTMLRKNGLLPKPAAGFVLLTVYDDAVVRHDGGSSAAAASTRPLPCDAVWVSCTDAAAATVEPSALAVAPADMEWIGLTNEAVFPHHQQQLQPQQATAQPPQGLLRRCSAALLSVSSSSNLAAEPSTPPQFAKAAAGTQATQAASAQSCAAGRALIGSLGVLAGVLDARQDTPTREDFSEAELVRTVATCVRNVPAHRLTASAPDADGLSEDIVQAVLALEAQCALRVSEAQAGQRIVVHARLNAMSCATQRGAPPPSSGGDRSGAMRRGAGGRGRTDVDNVEAEMGIPSWGGSRHERGSKEAMVTVMYGYAVVP